MVEAKKDAALAKVLRFLLTVGDASFDGEGFLAANGRKEAASRAVLEEAVRLGLVTPVGDRLRATPEAKSHLRRRLCETETPFAA
ncbi:hypothetical protein, partial [Shinella sp.]|uniref:hypothetical protein n=1 Tax=Shinella sp. TaxID=1870904 RepID=UPI0028AD6E95